MSNPNEFKRPAVTIHGEVAAYARKAADVLDSSGNWLREHIELDEKIDPESELDMALKREDLKITANNLARGAAFLRWLADFEEGGPNHG